MISVLIPTFNSERYISEAIESVLAQSLKELEIVVVDDGSTDGTEQVISNYLETVKYFRQENLGPGAARNSCVRHSTGDFLAFLDADDVWTPEKLERQMYEFENEPALDMIFGMVRQTHQSNWEKESDKTTYGSVELVEGKTAGTMLIRRESFLRVGMFPENYRVGEFVHWFSRANEIGLKSKTIKDLVYRRRIHSTNLGVINQGEYGDFLKILKESIDRRKLTESENLSS